MITLTRRYRFSAAHQLTNMPEGHRCARLHGHTYIVMVTVAAWNLNNGMVLDAYELDGIVRPILDLLDHHPINTLAERLAQADRLTAAVCARVVSEQPTAENIAAWLFNRIECALEDPTRVVSVTVYESEDLWATAMPEAR